MKMIGYKGFDKDFRCRDFQFKVGETYEHKGGISLCSSGFHFVTNPLDAFGYYLPAYSRFALINAEDASAETENDSKRVCRKITIVKELTLAEMTAARIEQFDWSKANKGTASGDSGAATASGCGGAATASGCGGAATASGDSGAATASGYGGAATASGDSGAATASGIESCACALGIEGTARGILGTWLTISEWKYTDSWHRIDVKTVKVDGKKIKADTFYKLVNGKFVEVK